METFSLLIEGHNPAPQGSKRYAGHRVHPTSHKSVPYLAEDSPRTKKWRYVVTLLTRQAMARRGMAEPLDGQLHVRMAFVMQPKDTMLRQLAKDPKLLPTSRAYGDIDKLQRATFDGITDAGLIKDDSRVVSVEAMKVFPGQVTGLDSPGCLLQVAPANLTAMGMGT